MDCKRSEPDDIRLDGDTQPRVQLIRSTVEEYAEAIQRGDTMPPAGCVL